jgi:hypothetical protein
MSLSHRGVNVIPPSWCHYTIRGVNVMPLVVFISGVYVTSQFMVSLCLSFQYTYYVSRCSVNFHTPHIKCFVSLYCLLSVVLISSFVAFLHDDIHFVLYFFVHFLQRLCRYVTMWYNMIYLLTAIVLTPGGSSTVRIYTQIIHRTKLTTRTTEQHD